MGNWQCICLGLPKPSDQDARGSLAMGKKGKFSYGIDGVWTNFQNAGIDPKADHIHLIKANPLFVFCLMSRMCYRDMVYIMICNTVR